MMECVDGTGVSCSSSVVSGRCIELLDERRICKNQMNQRGRPTRKQTERRTDENVNLGKEEERQ